MDLIEVSDCTDRKLRIRVQVIAEALGEIEGSEQRLMDVRKEGCHTVLSLSSLLQCSQRLDSRLLKVEWCCKFPAYVCSPRASIAFNNVFGWFVCVIRAP